MTVITAKKYEFFVRRTDCRYGEFEIVGFEEKEISEMDMIERINNHPSWLSSGARSILINENILVPAIGFRESWIAPSRSLYFLKTRWNSLLATVEFFFPHLNEPPFETSESFLLTLMLCSNLRSADLSVALSFVLPKFLESKAKIRNDILSLCRGITREGFCT